MLVYEPQPDGSLVLVAVENLVFASAWHEGLGNKEPPKFHGRPYELLKDKPETKVDEAHGWEPHYERHVWVLRDNPNGIYSPFNPNVTCRHHKPPATPAPAAAAASQSVDPEKARGLVRSGALLVDVREPFELAQSGWLKGAINRPMSSFTEQARALPKDRPIILYCRSGRRSSMAADLLTAMGFAQVYKLGAFDAAARGGMPTVAP
jgi:rhodanese-related sulfurtransferase